jgi:hypothetical protein
MSNAAADIVNSAITSLTGPVGYTQTQPYIILTHIRLVNKTGAAATASLFIGAVNGSAAGTEFAFNAYSIPANSYVDWYGRVRLESGDHLSGLASASATITFQAEGEIGLT